MVGELVVDSRGWRIHGLLDWWISFVGWLVAGGPIFLGTGDCTGGGCAD
jgi:hypothetical protein